MELGVQECHQELCPNLWRNIILMMGVDEDMRRPVGDMTTYEGVTEHLRDFFLTIIKETR